MKLIGKHIKIVCGRCDTVLYEGHEVIAPLDLILLYNSECPKCGKKLKFDYRRVRIHPSKEVKTYIPKRVIKDGT